jgi:hypothetical protein
MPWTAGRPRRQRRHAKTAGDHPIGGDPVFFHQALQPVDAAMRRTPAGEGLVAELSDAPALAELVERRGIGLAVEQSKIAEIPGNRRMRPRHAAAGQLDRGHRAACGKTDLHRQLRRSFAVRLHRAGALPIIDPDCVAQLCAIEAGQHRETRGGAESAGIGRPEEAHRGARAQA